MTREEFNLSDAAAYAGVSRFCLRRAIAGGRVRAYRLSKKVIRIERAELDAWRDRCATGRAELRAA